MRIDINQEKIALSAEYKIHLNGEFRYHAVKKLLRFLAEINLFDQPKNRARFQITKNFTLFNTSYDLKSYDNRTFEFRTVNFFKAHYKCQVGGDLYEIYAHSGRKYSIFKNDSQIGWWDKEMVSWFSGDNYMLITDDDCDYDLLISFCLILDNSKSRNNGGNAINLDFGRIGPQAKPFDPNWKPKLSNENKLNA